MGVEATLRRFDPLTEAGGAIDGPVFDQGLAKAAHVAATHLGTWCVVDEVHGGEVRPRAFAHGDPNLEPCLARLLRQREAALLVDGPPGALRDGRIAHDLGPCHPSAVAHAIGVADLETVMHLGARSYASIPLVGHEGLLGAMTIVSGCDQRLCTLVDLASATDLATCAALLLDNARLAARSRDALRFRDEFVSAASHELRTPLHALRLQLQSLESQLRSPTPDLPALGSWLGIAQRQVDRLTNLVTGLLTTSDALQGPLVLAVGDADFAAVLRAAVASVTPSLDRTKTTLEMQGPTSLAGRFDARRLEEALRGVLQNAIKFGPGRPIRVSLASCATRARIAVADSGIGICAADLERIFERYERAISPRSYGGVGVGLFAANAIVQAHGGGIAATSTPGAGATFTIDMPLDATA